MLTPLLARVERPLSRPDQGAVLAFLAGHSRQKRYDMPESAKTEAKLAVQLDRFERRILNLLQEDASLSTAEIAEKVGLSSSPCWRRITRLEADGLIVRRVALLNRRKLGLETQIFAQVKLNAHGRANLDEFAAAIRGFDEVLECHVLLGDMDFLLRIVARSIEAYERFFFEKLSRIAGVQEINSTVALSEIKSTTALPVDGPSVE